MSANPQVRAAARPLAPTPFVPHPLLSRLSDRDRLIVQTVERFRLVSSGQIERLYFADGSPASRSKRCRRTLARLSKWGHIQRLQRAVGGIGGGSGGYLYIPAGYRTRVADPHTLDITDLYVQLKESAADLDFDPEPYSHVYLGHLELKPDFTVYINGRRFWGELDRGTEWRTQLSKKMRQYTNAYQAWREDKFPGVLWIVPDEQRARLVESVCKRQEHPGIFKVCLYSEALAVLTADKH